MNDSPELFSAFFCSVYSPPGILASSRLHVGRLSVPHSRMLSGPAAAVAGSSDNRRMHLQCGDIVEFPVYK